MSGRILWCWWCASVMTQVEWIIGKTEDSHLVQCGNCGARGPRREDEDAAIAAWNKGPQSEKDLVDAMRKAQP